MAHPLIEFLSRYTEISPGLESSLLNSGLFQDLPKGTILLRQSEPVSHAYFVLNGCVRSYAIRDGDERTLDFYIEEQPIVPVGYGRGAPAEHFLECVEDTSAVVNTVDQEERMIREHPELLSLCRTMAEVMAEKLRENLTRLQTTTAEQRYIYLRENRPDLLQRIPQYQIASYLGVQPESLSRIRRRLSHPVRRR